MPAHLKPRLSYAPLARRFDNQVEMARITGIPRRTLAAWVKRGVPADRADAIAVALGAHPSEIWPQEWYEVNA